MRELKFRIWNELQFVTESEVYIKASNGSLWDYDDGNLWSATAKIQQFTGLLDKNGVEIYEGDFIRFEKQEGVWSDQLDTITEVKYPFVCGNAHLGQVIGNIFENSELLKA